MSRDFIKPAVALLAVFALPVQVAFADCGPEQYFAASDFDHKTPLAAPPREFADDLRKAKAGDHTAQRNIAISYETGYQVGQCDEQAAYWYAKAAKGGDKAAAQWVEEHAAAERLAARPSCIGDACNAMDSGPQRMTLVASGASGHYFTTLSINGVTVNAIIDTGASTVAMSTDTAKKLKISDEGFTRRLGVTANGVVTAYSKTIPQIQVGSIDVRNVEIDVLQSATPTLIGMSALRQLKVSVDNNNMTLSSQ